jgi:hypothetical protein
LEELAHHHCAILRTDRLGTIEMELWSLEPKGTYICTCSIYEGNKPPFGNLQHLQLHESKFGDKRASKSFCNNGGGYPTNDWFEYHCCTTTLNTHFFSLRPAPISHRLYFSLHISRYTLSFGCTAKCAVSSKGPNNSVLKFSSAPRVQSLEGIAFLKPATKKLCD